MLNRIDQIEHQFESRIAAQQSQIKMQQLQIQSLRQALDRVVHAGADADSHHHLHDADNDSSTLSEASSPGYSTFSTS